MDELDHQLDLRGLRCPLPVLRVEAASRKLPAGTQLRVLTDDPIARIDIPHAMSQAGHACELMTSPDKNGAACVFRVTLSGLE